MKTNGRIAVIGGILLLGAAQGCGSNSGFLNPAFVNFAVGGQFPSTPGPIAPFVLVRVINATPDKVIEFKVSVEKTVPVRDDNGEIVFDNLGIALTNNVFENARLQTPPFALANDLGIVFSCDETPIVRIGLGENLGALEPQLFVTSDASDFGGGCNVGVNPLVAAAGNFNCGDTVIFQAFESVAGACGVGVKTLVLPGSEQPATFAGPSTFEILRQFQLIQVTDDD